MQALGLSAWPKRMVISALGMSSIWCERARKSNASIMRGMWQETQRLASESLSWWVCAAAAALSASWRMAIDAHAIRLILELQRGVLDGPLWLWGSWQLPQLALPLRKHWERSSASTIKVVWLKRPSL